MEVVVRQGLHQAREHGGVQAASARIRRKVRPANEHGQAWRAKRSMRAQLPL